MANTPTPTRLYQPANVGVQVLHHDCRWATRVIPSGALGIQNFFGAAPSQDRTADYYEQPATLVTSGKAFTIYGIALKLLAGASGTLQDIEKVINSMTLRLISDQREWLNMPVHMIPAGGGLVIQSGQVAVTPGATPGAMSPVGAINGNPERKVMCLRTPLEIGANQQFYAELLAPTAGSAFGTQTLTGAVIAQLVLEGIETRAAG